MNIDYDQEYRTLRRINAKLEEALREVIHLQSPHALDMQIKRIRAEIDTRAEDLRELAKGEKP